MFDCDPIRIPVVFHIFSPPETPVGLLEEANVSDFQIIRLLDELNWRLANGPEEDGLVTHDFNFVGEDLAVQFVLATEDINGNDAIGIVRYSDNNIAYLNGTNNSWQEVAPNWPSDQYANIAVFQKKCSTINWADEWGPEDACLCTPLTPSATFPPRSGNFEDGFAFGAKHFFASKSLAHEVGHYLGLFHTFDDEIWDENFLDIGNEPLCNNLSCWQDGDEICDTPPQSGSLNCNFNSCDTDVISGPFTTDINDFTENYMGNTQDCRSAFTLNQVQRMNICLENDGFRNNLNNSSLGNPIDQVYLLDWEYQNGCVFTSNTEPLLHLLNLSTDPQDISLIY